MNQIDVSAIVGYPLKISFHDWQEGVSWSTSNSESIIPNAYDDPSFPIDFLIHQPELKPWVQSFPKNILAQAIAFEECFTNYMFSALFFSSRSKAAEELFLDAPILVWMIIAYAEEQALEVDDALSLFDKKRTYILQLQGLPASKAVLKFLYRLEFSSLKKHDLPNIKIFLKHFDIIQINRIKRINYKLIQWLINYPNWIDAKFIQHSDNLNIYQMSHYLTDTLRMGQQLDVQQLEQRIKQCNSFGALALLHDRFVATMNERNIKKYEGLVFPVAPLEGSDNIKQIMDYASLVMEGKSMHHCIASYAKNILAQQYYVFQIFEPERATIGIHYRNGKLKIDQIKLACNQMPSDATKEEVFYWFSNEV